MIGAALAELDREAIRIAAATADHRARRLFELETRPAELPVAIVVPRGRRGWR